MPVSTSRRAEKHTPPRPEYISPDDAAARWSVSRDTIRRLISSGQITGYRLNGRIIRVDAAEVDAAFRPIPTVTGR